LQIHSLDFYYFHREEELLIDTLKKPSGALIKLGNFFLTLSRYLESKDRSGQITMLQLIKFVMISDQKEKGMSHIFPNVNFVTKFKFRSKFVYYFALFISIFLWSSFTGLHRFLLLVDSCRHCLIFYFVISDCETKF